jgi:hypothetical protein
MSETRDEIMALPTRTLFMDALKRVPMPGGRQLDFLREHAHAPGRALRARRLAQAVGYRNHGGINLRYRLLAQTNRERTRPEERESFTLSSFRPVAFCNKHRMGHGDAPAICRCSETGRLGIA